ncbi:MAG: DUF2510 domain-containing protein [Propionibacteriaceae bacterium]
MSAKSGWYPDPGGGQGLYRFWDGHAWSAATSPNPAAPPPAASLGSTPPPPIAGQGSSTYGSSYGQGGMPYGQQSFGQGAGQPAGGQPSYGASGGTAYASYQASTAKRKTPVGWWLGAVALVVVIVVIAVVVVRGLTGGGLTAGPGNGQPTTDICPREVTPTAPPPDQPGDGRVHGGPLSYPQLGSPWDAPSQEIRVPFGNDVMTQTVTVEANYAPGSSWVASVLVGELQAGDGFYTPQQGAGIVVKCILGRFYGDNEVQSNVKVNKAGTVDGHEAWTVESQLTFDIPNLKTKGELLIVTIVANGSTAGLFYASIPDTTPELVAPAREALKNLKVDG